MVLSHFSLTSSSLSLSLSLFMNFRLLSFLSIFFLSLSHSPTLFLHSVPIWLYEIYPNQVLSDNAPRSCFTTSFHSQFLFELVMATAVSPVPFHHLTWLTDLWIIEMRERTRCDYKYAMQAFTLLFKWMIKTIFEKRPLYYIMTHSRLSIMTFFLISLSLFI
jgi:hypothetical protein